MRCGALISHSESDPGWEIEPVFIYHLTKRWWVQPKWQTYCSVSVVSMSKAELAPILNCWPAV